MACFEKNSFSKIWIINRYSKLTKQKNWETMSSSDLGEALTLTVTSTSCLLISSGNEIYEYVNLWTGKENFSGVFKGNSLLITHQLKDLIRKFRVEFLGNSSENSEQNCQACVRELSRFVVFKAYDKSDKIKSGCLSQINDSVVSTSEVNNKPGEMKSISLKDLAQHLLKKSEVKLPLFYQQDLMTVEKDKINNHNNDDNNEETRVLQEYIKMCLLDPGFGEFVKKVEKELVNLIISESGSE